MKTDAVTAHDLSRSVIAVPPLARAANGAISIAENRRILDWMASGGVSTFLYGGNANFYNLGILEFPLTLEVLAGIAPPNAWIIPSIGPDFGKALDQVSMLKSFDFPTAMALPMTSATKPDGVATGLRRLADAYGRPVVAYVRGEGYIAPRDIAALIADGVVCSLKYAVERKEPIIDDYLAEIVAAAGPERIVSGIGERPAIAHFRHFGLRSFTSGSVAIAPHMSSAILAALTAGDFAGAEAIRAAFLPFEDQRDAWSPIVVLHDGVGLAGVADTGPLQPFLANLPAGRVDAVAAAARALHAANARHIARAAA